MLYQNCADQMHISHLREILKKLYRSENIVTIQIIGKSTCSLGLYRRQRFSPILNRFSTQAIWFASVPSLCGMDSRCGSSNQGADFLYGRPGFKTQALCLGG